MARETERRIDLGMSAIGPNPSELKTVADLIDSHIADMTEVGKPLRRSKANSLDLLKSKLGSEIAADLSRQLIVDFGRMRRTECAGPTMVGMDISYLKMIVTHAAVVHGLNHSTEAID
ncbi:MAG: hypothetical protein AAFP97_11075 [Pseudomonadota bacterium]